MQKATDGIAPRLEALLLEALSFIRAQGSSSFTEGGEVLLNVELDGIRCLFTRPATPMPRSLNHLSAREQEIARMVAKGYPNKTIAAVLDISCWTVNTHLRRIFAKLGVHNRAAMVAALLEEGGRDNVADTGKRHLISGLRVPEEPEEPVLS